MIATNSVSLRTTAAGVLSDALYADGSKINLNRDTNISGNLVVAQDMTVQGSMTLEGFLVYLFLC
jgi:hypothetical protein